MHSADNCNPLSDLSESDIQLIRSGLDLLRTQQTKALTTARASGIKPGGREFQPWDFGLPQIEKLIAKIDG